MYPYLSLIPLGLIYAGFAYRRRNRVHIPLVLLGILLDSGLIVALETQRHVINKAAQTVSPLLKFHIAVAVSAVVVYIVMLITGTMLLWGHRTRKPHKLLGFYVLGARTIVSLTAFFVVP